MIRERKLTLTAAVLDSRRDLRDRLTKWVAEIVAAKPAETSTASLMAVIIVKLVIA